MNVNVDLIEQNVIEINVETTVNGDLSVKKAMYGKKITLGMLLHVIVKMENI